MRFLLLAGAITLYASPALAYLDPSAGGMLFQFLFPILATITGALVTARKTIGRWAAEVKRRLQNLTRS